jgi:Gram-negative bacterial TonB protein C-terminal
MANLASLFQVAEAPQSTSTVTDRVRDIEEDGPLLLELRTENGAVYLRPSRWQRLRLQWTFRHFHVLSPQVLSRADRRLIKKLSRSAVVTPALPVASKAIFGVIEKARSRPPASANRVVTLRPAPAARQGFLAKPETPALPSPVLSLDLKRKETKALPGGTKTTGVGDLPFRQWRDLGALAAVGLVVILASVYRAPLLSTTAKMWNPRTPIEHAANNIKPPALLPPAISPRLVSPTAVWLAKTEKPRPWIAPLIAPPTPGPALAAQAPATAEEGMGQSTGSVTSSKAPALDTIPELAPAAPSAASARRFVAELPQGYFAHPFVSDSNPVGELQLKALIGADGSVKEVTVLSGSPELAEAGVRAVRKWHYSPYLVQGSPVEVETQIKMSFFGPDAVSIASVANGSTSQSK